MQRIGSDLRLAARVMRRNKAFTATVVLLLGLGVGASTTIFSVVDAVLLKRLPYPEAERLVYVSQGSHTGPDMRAWQENAHAFDALAAVWETQVNLTGSGRPARLRAMQLTPGFHELLAARAHVGRLFAEDEFGPGGSSVVLGFGFWQRRFGGDPAVLGDEVLLDGRAFTVIGVLAPDFVLPEVLTGTRVDLWLPIDLTQVAMNDRRYHILSVVGRLREGVTLEAARAEMDALAERLAAENPDRNRRRDGTVRTFPLVPLHEATVGRTSATLLMLLGAVGLLLLIACANVAHLMLVRGAERAREFAVRTALGAGRAGLMGQLLTESLVISLAGGALGVGLALGGVRVFRALQPGGIPRVESVAIDHRVLFFALAISVITGVLFSVLPVLQALRTEAQSVLKEHAANVTAGGRRRRVQSALVVGEIALSLVLLTGAGLLFTSLLRLKGVSPGFAAGEVITIPLQLRGMGDGPPAQGEAAERLAAQVHQILDRVRPVPGVRSVAAGITAPFDWVGGSVCCWQTGARTSADVDIDDALRTSVNPVTSGYFATLGIPLAAGREFGSGDVRADPTPAVINGEMARQLFSESTALGRTFLLGDMAAIVVGIASDVRHYGADQPFMPQAFVPYDRLGGGMPFVTIIVRTGLPASSIAASVRDAIWSAAPDLPIDDLSPVTQRIRSSMAAPRFYLALIGTFAVAALLLATGGIYGTLLYGVRIRQRELGIRLALGARSAQVVRMVVLRGLLLVAAGLMLGVAGSIAASRALAGLLFEVSTTDPRTIAAVSLLLGAVALAASWLPARKAGRTDPMCTLRAE